MAQIETIKGENFVLAVDLDGTGAGALTMVGCATTSELTRQTASQEATCKASGGWEESQPHTKSWEMTTDGLYQPTSDVSAIDFHDAWVKGTVFEASMGVQGTSGGTYFKGNVYITSLSNSSPNGENVTYSVTLKGTGKLDKVVITLVLTVPTATATSALGKITVSWTNVASESGYELQVSTDGIAWEALATPAADVTTFDHALAAGTKRFYRVRAIGNGSTVVNSDWSATVTATAG